MVLALALCLSMLPTTVLGAAAFTEETASATVRVTMSNDGAVLLGNDSEGSRVNLMEVTVPYFDLALYGLEQFYRYEAASFDEGGEYINDTVIEQPTLLHLYIYLLERFYYGLPEEDCCKGTAYLKSQGITFGENTDAYDELGNSTGSNQGLHITGSATHLYMSNFWGHDENLMYYVNHSYPLMRKGVGATADYILLEDGDEVDLALFTNWGFYTQGFFCYMNPSGKTVNSGESVTFQSYGVPTYAVSDGSTAPTEDVSVNWCVLDAVSYTHLTLPTN